MYGTNEESNAATKTLNVRSSYNCAGGIGTPLPALEFRLDDSTRPLRNPNTDLPSTAGTTIGINGFHCLPWNGSVSLSYNHSSYSGNYGSSMEPSKYNSTYDTNTQTALVSFHPTNKLSLFANETFTDNLNGYFYQNLVNGGGGVPILQTNSAANSFTMSSGANYLIMPHLFTQAQYHLLQSDLLRSEL